MAYTLGYVAGVLAMLRKERADEFRILASNV
jgi:hypothetical protein